MGRRRHSVTDYNVGERLSAVLPSLDWSELFVDDALGAIRRYVYSNRLPIYSQVHRLNLLPGSELKQAIATRQLANALARYDDARQVQILSSALPILKDLHRRISSLNATRRARLQQPLDGAT